MRNKSLVGFILGILVAGAVALVACGTQSQDSVDRQTVQAQQNTYTSRQPIPQFDWSRQRDTLIQIYQLTNEARSTYSVLTSQGTGQMIYACPSVGYPIPADTQLTNPLTVQRYWINSTAVDGVVEQPEPSGLYSSHNTDATWVLCVRKNGDVAPIYTEQKLTTFPFAVRYNKDTGMIEEDESSPTTIKIVVKNATGTGLGKIETTHTDVSSQVTSAPTVGVETTLTPAPAQSYVKTATPAP